MASLKRLAKRTFELGSKALYRDAALYEQLYRRRQQDVRFYVELARRHGGPVLELGAGTGRVTLAIAAAGVSIVGLDTMPTMLARAHARLALRPAAERERVSLRRADLRSLRMTQRFPLVIAPFNVLQHTATGEELQRALERCARLLAPGGLLAFDVLNPDVHALAQNPDRIYRVGHITHPVTKVRYKLSESSHYDADEQIRTVHMFLDPVAGGAELLVVPLAQRQIFPEELKARLSAAGLAIQARYGDFERGPFDSSSESQVILARAHRPR